MSRQRELERGGRRRDIKMEGEREIGTGFGVSTLRPQSRASPRISSILALLLQDSSTTSISPLAGRNRRHLQLWKRCKACGDDFQSDEGALTSKIAAFEERPNQSPPPAEVTRSFASGRMVAIAESISASGSA